MNSQQLTKFIPSLRRPSLQMALIVPWILLILTVVGLVSYLSFRNSQQAIALLADRLHKNLSGQVQQHLDQYLTTPNQVNQQDLYAIEQGLLNVKDFPQTGKFFWKQMQVFESLSYLSYGTAEGEFIGIERLDNGELVLNEIKKSTQLEKLHIYSINDRGDRTNLRQIKDWNPRSEPWYTETVAAQKPIWSSIFQWQDKPDVMSVTANHPMYSRDRQLQGVLSIDLTLTQIQQFLKNIAISPSSRVFLAERNGVLIGSSGNQAVTETQPQMRRISAIESADPMIRLTAQHLYRTFPEWYQIQQTRSEKFTIAGQPHFLQVTPWEDKLGLKWLIVVVTPESEFMQPIYRNTGVTIVLSGLATLGGIILSIALARWVARPIQRLNLASQRIAAGNLSQPIPVLTGSQETIGLSQSFEQMRSSLSQAQMELSDYAKSLEHRVEERTSELQQINQELTTALMDLQNTQDHLVQSEKLAALGKLIASIAHEMNTPLGVIQSSIMNIISYLREDLEQLPQLLQGLSVSQQGLFFELMQGAISGTVELMAQSRQDKRQWRRELWTKLQAEGIQPAELIADRLVELGIYQDFARFKPLLHSPQVESILNIVYGIASVQQSALTITQATTSASKFVLALKTYSYKDNLNQKVQIDLVQSIEVALVVYHNLIKRNITVVRQYPEHLPKISAFAEDMQQIWTNIIRNAIQAMDYQGTLTIVITALDQSLQVSIIDDGPGIPPEVMPRIFEPFFTTKPQGEGSGLGLSIIQKLIDRHQGQITVTSQPGQTTVTVILPINAPTPTSVDKLDS
jgi:signal transduction histidine kinase